MFGTLLKKLYNRRKYLNKENQIASKFAIKLNHFTLISDEKLKLTIIKKKLKDEKYG